MGKGRAWIGLLVGLAGAGMIGWGLSALVPAWLGPKPDIQPFGWTFGGTFLGSLLLPLLIGLLLWRAVAAKRAIVAELMRTGVPGIGTAIEVGDIGATNDDDPRITIRMRIEPLDGSAAVERSKEVTVTQVVVPRLGERYPAWFDRTDRDRWIFATEMEEGATAEVKEMFARARSGGYAADDSPVGELARPPR